jgi:hypothetical protein
VRTSAFVAGRGRVRRRTTEVLAAERPLHRRAYRLQFRFPYVMAETPVEWFEGMIEASPERPDDVGSLRALLALVAGVVRADGRAEALSGPGR